MGRPRKKLAAKGFSDLMIGQFLLAALFYVMIAFYESHRTVALGIGFVLLMGMLFFSIRGFRQLWFKKSKQS